MISGRCSALRFGIAALAVNLLSVGSAYAVVGDSFMSVPGIKGATASAQVKPATLETGLVINVPSFINEGDRIRVNTDTGEYQGRV